MEEYIKCMLGDRRLCVKDVNLSWYCRVKHHAAYVGWEQTHYGESQAGAVRHAVQVGLFVAEGVNQIVYISSIGDGRIRLKIAARVCQTSAARLSSLNIRAGLVKAGVLIFGNKLAMGKLRSIQQRPAQA